MSYMVQITAVIAAFTCAIMPSAAFAQAAELTTSQNVDIYARYGADDKITTERLEDGQFRARIPLAAIRAQQGSILLQGTFAQELLGLNVAPQVQVQEAKLLLRHVTGRGQEAADPHLRIGLNGQFVAQLDGSTSLTAALDEIKLDARQFQPGYNTFAFEAIQRYTYECQNPLAAELWTEIDTSRSEIEIIYSREDFTGSLADLNAFVSPGIGGVDRLVIATASDELDDQKLAWGTVISQTIADRLEYRLPAIQHGHVRKDETTAAPGNVAPNLGFDRADIDASSDIILIGRFEELGDIVSVDPDTVLENEGYLALGPSPLDPTHFIIVASGHNDLAVSRAIDALALSSFPFSDHQETRITELDAPTGVAIGERAPLRTGVAYTFANLGYKTHSVNGVASTSTEISFELPVDTYFTEKDEVTLSLDFAYGAGLNEKSVMNILVNDTFRSAISLQNARGDAVSGYEVRMPARAFRGGKNKLSLQAELSKDQHGSCAERNDRHLAFMIEESSLIRIPKANRFVELPNLELLSASGYPYSGVSNEPFAIHVAGKSDETVAAAWTLLARIGQIYGDRFRGVEVKFDNQPAEEHTLLIGARQALGEIALGNMDLANENIVGNEAVLNTSLPRNESRFVTTSQSTSLGRNGLLMSGENPVANNTLLTVLTAQSSSDLLAATRALVAPSHWSQLSGADAVWRDNPATFATEVARETFFIGDLDGRERVAYLNSRHPWRFILGIGFILFLAASILAWIAHFLRKQLDKGDV